MLKKSKVWKTIADSKVRMIWKCNDKHCKFYKKDFAIPPSWYENNGTPVCDCDIDMVYVRTEIRK